MKKNPLYFGALSKGRKMGELGDAACFSLGRGKAVCGGEGGVLVTNNKQLYEQAIALTQHPVRIFRETGSEPISSSLDELSWNYRIHPLAAVLALADLQLATDRIPHRQSILNTIHQKLKSIPGIKPVSCYPDDSSAAYGIPLAYDSSELKGISRESLLGQFQDKGIMN
jgi:dTDP-4-amino-4,6-dideoxygalactose transaminase